MRFQQQWGTSLTKMNQISTDCQDNLVAILRRAILEFGINHIETARGYGCSELQLGCAFQQLFASGEIQRKDLIIQTKVPPYEDPNEFREQLEQSLASLQLDYIDLFGFHGLNGTWQWDWMFRDDPEKGNCWQVIQEYRQAGRIRFVGFSTHGPTDLIHRLIETDKFDYANVHHHFCGSYTASGDGPGHEGNISCLRKMKERDMGGACG
jgi:predicted aldo/keto reductase-like oxidoreductase